MAVALIFAVTFALYLRLHPALDQFVSAIDGVLGGYPHWRLFQSRVLTPLLYGVVRVATGLDQSQSYLVTAAGLCFAFQITLMITVRTITRDSFSAILAGVIAFGASVFVVTSKSWFYLWDLVDLSVFCGVAYCLVRDVSLRPLVLLIGLEVFNREVAQVLALGLVLDAVWRIKLLPRAELVQRSLVGLALLSSSLIASECLRRSLLVQESGFAIWPDTDVGSLANVQFGRNVLELAQALRSFSWETLRWSVVLALPVGMAWLVRRSLLGSLAGFFYLLWMATFVFGVANEWRVWFWMVPFVLIALAVVHGGSLTSRPADKTAQIVGL